MLTAYATVLPPSSALPTGSAVLVLDARPLFVVLIAALAIATALLLGVRRARRDARRPPLRGFARPSETRSPAARREKVVAGA